MNSKEESLAGESCTRKEWLDSLEFHDAYCQLFVGMNGKADCVSATKASLLAELDRCGVSKALVCSGSTPEVGAVKGNKDLADAVSGSDRLKGIWCILPHHCGELPPPDKFFDEMKRNNIGGITLHPIMHKWVPSKITIGKYMEAAIERKVPVFIGTNNLGSWEEVYRFMELFPEATTVVTKVGLWGCDRMIRPLLENYKNLYMDLGMYWIPEGIRDLAEEYGAERLLYASDLPDYSAGTLMLPLVNSGLSREGISLIASGNIKRLLSWE